MATIQVTNRVAASALRNQAVRVYLDTTETTDDLPQIVAGQAAVIDATSKKARVRSVDTYGRSFVLEVNQSGQSLESTAGSGVLAVSATVTITL